MATLDELARLAVNAMTMTAPAVNDVAVRAQLAGTVRTLRQELLDSEGHLSSALRPLIALDEQGNLCSHVLNTEALLRGRYDSRIASALDANFASMAGLLVRSSAVDRESSSDRAVSSANPGGLPQLNFPGEWRFASVRDIPALPEAVGSYLHEMLLRVAESAPDRWAIVELFKRQFGGAYNSSSIDWAHRDLLDLIKDREKNAVLTIVGAHECFRYAATMGLPFPDFTQINELLVRNGVNYRIDPPDLLRIADASTSVIAKSVIKPKDEKMPDSQKVFIIHGRNHHARAQIELFVRSLGLTPVEFDELAADQGAAFIGDIVRAGLEQAQGIVAMFTSDEYAGLRPEYRVTGDPSEDAMRWQARPNVIFEAGMAYGMAPKRTILLTLGGEVRLFSDITGLHIIPLDNSRARRSALRQKLIGVGCTVNERTDAWADPDRAGDFDSTITKLKVVTPRDPF